MTSFGSPREALLVLDTNLVVRAANRAFYEIFKLAPAECIGQKVYELGGRAWNPKLRTMLEAVLQGEAQSDHFELIDDAKEPGHDVLWLSARMLPSSDEAEATILLSIEDLTAGLSPEDTLARKTAELQGFAELASRGSHELNNLLTVIRMNADLLRLTLGDAKLPVSEVDDIIGAAERAEVLTKELLLSSRRALPQPTALDRGDATVPLPGSPLRESEEETLAREEAGRRNVRPLKHGEATGGETILLVEDEKALRKLGKRVLTDAGYRVLEAADGAMALRIAAEEVGEIDLVLSDVEMPTLGGRGMVAELHELSPGMRILFMSGYTDNEILRRGIKTSESDFLQKPFTAETLCAAVRSALSKPPTASA